jgi:hypothetical protein
LLSKLQGGDLAISKQSVYCFQGSTAASSDVDGECEKKETRDDHEKRDNVLVKCGGGDVDAGYDDWGGLGERVRLGTPKNLHA